MVRCPPDWTRYSGVTVFPSARGSKNRYPAEGVSPRAWSRRPSACVWRSGYWFESEEQIKQEPQRRSLWGSCFIGSPDWTRTSNPSINSRMLCQLSYGGIFCFRCAVSLATSNNYTGGPRGSASRNMMKCITFRGGGAESPAGRPADLRATPLPRRPPPPRAASGAKMTRGHRRTGLCF